MNGLSDKWQAVATMASSALIAVGAITYPTNAETGLALAVIGAIGFGIKEAIGGQTPAKT
jgi:hypothetical protein